MLNVVPDKVTAPEFWIVRGPIPLVVTLPPKVNEVPAKLIPELPLVMSVPNVVDPASWAMLTAEMAAVVLPAPDVIWKAPIEVSAWLNVIEPVPASSVKSLAPDTAPEITIFPAPVLVLIVVAPSKTIVFKNERFALEVEIVPNV